MVRLDIDALNQARGRIIPSTVGYMAVCQSTQDVVRRLALQGTPEGYVLLTDFQAAGRGRLDRKWTCPDGKGLLMSILLRPRMPPEMLGLITFCLGVATARACRLLAGPTVGLKWPNDIICQGRKLGGILAEIVFQGATPAVAVGLGLNLNLGPSELPERTIEATSLMLEVGHLIDRTALAASILEAVDLEYCDLVENGGTGLLRRWRALSATLGEPVVVDVAGNPLIGEAVDVDDQGRLIILQPHGTLTTVDAGDVRHLRSAIRSDHGRPGTGPGRT